MLETASILGLSAAIVLLVAVIAWIKLLRGPLMQRADGKAEIDPLQGELASKLLVGAAGLSTVAVVLAVGGCIVR